MSRVGRLRRTGTQWCGLILAAGPLALAGCGGEEPAPSEVASSSPPPSAHSAPAGGPPPGMHGAPGAAAGGMHGGPPPGAPGAHGGPPAGHGGPPSQPAPAGGHDDGTQTAQAAPSGNPYGNAAPGFAHGGGNPGGPAASHGAPGTNPYGNLVAGGPGGAHGGITPGASHGGPPGGYRPPGSGGSPYAAHGGPPAAPGQAPSGQKPSTEEWLGGLAAGILGGDASQQPVGAPGAAHGEGGDVPGVSGYPGVATGSPYDTPGASGAATKQYEPGTAENAVQRLVLKLQAGDTTGYEEIISDKTKDAILAPLRDGQIDADTLAKAKEMSSGASLLNIRDSTASKLFMVRNGAGQTLTITTKREAGGYKVTGLKVDVPRGRRR